MSYTHTFEHLLASVDKDAKKKIWLQNMRYPRPIVQISEEEKEVAKDYVVDDAIYQDVYIHHRWKCELNWERDWGDNGNIYADCVGKYKIKPMEFRSFIRKTFHVLKDDQHPVTIKILAELDAVNDLLNDEYVVVEPPAYAHKKEHDKYQLQRKRVPYTTPRDLPVCGISHKKLGDFIVVEDLGNSYIVKKIEYDRVYGCFVVDPTLVYLDFSRIDRKQLFLYNMQLYIPSYIRFEAV